MPEAKARRLRHLEAAASEDFRNPTGVRETATGKSLEFPVQVILHASDCWLGFIQQQVCGAAIAVVRKTNYTLPVLATIISETLRM